MKKVINIIGAIFLVWYCVAVVVWQVRHPKANDMTILTHIVEVMTFKMSEELI